MPIFQDDLGGGRGPPLKKTPNLHPDEPLVDDVIRRKASEESIRTDFCDGPLPDSPDRRGGSPEGFDDHFVFPAHGTFDRVELIKRLKGAKSPTWLPNRQLESIQTYDQGTPRRQSPGASKSSPLLPPAEISESTRPATSDAERARAGLEIERPRSALHSGDFTEIARQSGAERTLQGSKLSLFDPEPQEWLSTSPPRDYNPFQIDTRFPSADPLTPDPATRDRAPSLSSSYSSSFVFKPPTSPLVQSESNEDLELSSFVNPIDITSSAQRHSRRHTLQAPHSMHSTPPMPSSSVSSRPLPNLRRDNTYPYQAHQPRRSLTLNPISPYPSASPQTPGFLRSRRPSYTSESSSLHASMVGSYEESILRGRMSTTPSKPLDFVAQIGVLGLGKCKASLKCPPHVTIPFPAVFYSYETTTHGRVGKLEDGPSPYVGQVDLENGLASPDEPRLNRKKLYSSVGERKLPQEISHGEISRPNTPSDDLRKAEKQKRGSTSPRAPPGGSYRIPEKGQLQIIIKNPNKTAVKLFLVPYDLAGMEPGTKTFIRQRSYSAGPIIDSALSSSAQPLASSPLDRPTLRYLVHLHICCVGRGRYFLYKSIRVVFANRVPDGKEKLRNEISLPEPRFSAYKPGRESGVGAGAGALLAAEKAFRRRSSGFALGPSHRTYESMDGNRQALDKGPGSGAGFSYGGDPRNLPIEPIPFQLSREHRRSEAFVRDQSTSQILSPTSSKSSGVPTPPGPGLPMSWNSDSPGINGYGKLAKGDIGYGGNAFSASPDGKQGVAEGLLAKKLRKLGVGLQNPQDRLDGV